MGVQYQAVTWNRYKRSYDLLFLVGALSYLLLFFALNRLWFPLHNPMTVAIRAFATLAMLLLHIILAIGPAARLSSSFLPLLYNRRHLGVFTFLVASVHGVLSLVWFHGGGNADPLVSLFTSNQHFNSLPWFPFEILGLVALMIMMVMAATSHDLWLSFLGPKAWKALHMLVYLSYALIIAHVALGILQLEQSPWLVLPLAAGMVVLVILHTLAAKKEISRNGISNTKSEDGWILVGRKNEFVNHRARVVGISGLRIAVFNNDGALSAVHNVCKHQMGPLGEGRIVDGCITCPWHGFQYKPEDGRAPAPFHEKLHTFRLTCIGDQVYVHPEALPEGTHVDPLRIDEQPGVHPPTDDFFIGWSGSNKSTTLRTTMRSAMVLVAGAIILAFVVVRAQRQVSSFRMDYDHVKVLEGWLVRTPVPMLRLQDGKDILLSDAGKFGASATVNEVLKGSMAKYVRMNGYVSQWFAHCGGDSVDCNRPCSQCLTGTNDYPVMEIGDAGVSAFQGAIPPHEFAMKGPEGYRDTVLRGEIIDPKCFFGAMNPGYGKTHLDCAARCLSGGIMPLLRWRTAEGDHYAVLTSVEGESLSARASLLTAVPVVVKGRWFTLNNWNYVSVTSLAQE